MGPELIADGPSAPNEAAATYRSWWRLAARDSLRYGRTRFGLILTVVIVLVALLGPLVAPHSASEIVDAPFAKPSSQALLGADYLGEDVFSRVLHGGRSILWMSIAAGLLGTIVGTALGITAGYSGRRTDEIIMRSLDVLLAIPAIIFTLLFLSMLGSAPLLIVALVGIAWVPSVARPIRASTLDVTRREYVEASQVIGIPRRRILIYEILPNLMTLVLVEFALRSAWSIGLIAGISFLGFGVQAPAADWGLMINENSIGLTTQPWGVVAPVAMVALFSLGVSLIAEGLSQAIGGSDRSNTK